MAHRILLVEDHTASRTTLALLLETSGYDVDAAANGREAVELLGEHGYDVIVSDIQMPAMDGFELFRAKGRGEKFFIVCRAYRYADPH